MLNRKERRSEAANSDPTKEVETAAQAPGRTGRDCRVSREAGKRTIRAAVRQFPGGNIGYAEAIVWAEGIGHSRQQSSRVSAGKGLAAVHRIPAEPAKPPAGSAR